MKKKIFYALAIILCTFTLISCRVDLPSGARYCSKCDGTGYIWPGRNNGRAHLFPSECTLCDGKGYYYPLFKINQTDDYYGGDVSFKGGSYNSCNIRNHDCPGGVDSNSDGWCDYCYYNGYKCHMVRH